MKILFLKEEIKNREEDDFFMEEEFKVHDIEDIVEIYFKGLTKPKHLRFFDEVTPKGNHITGYINQKPNRYLGSMIILTVNDEPVEQFIQSMPKINYPTDERDISYEYVSYCYEKLDGSCLIIYPLKDHNGEIIEIVPKTRGRPVADTHFVELYNHVDRLPIINFFKEDSNSNSILIFELYGILNQHEIIHYNVGVDIVLIGIYTDEGFINNPDIANKFGFKLPDCLFKLNYNPIYEDKWVLEFTSEKYKFYFPNTKGYYPTNTDAVLAIKHYLEELNNSFVSINGRLATEGVVINTIRPDGSKKWLKCKPRDIEVKHKSVNGIPRKSITKEVLKYFDEYGSDVKEIYKNDPTHHTEYIYRQLSEEYNEEMIFKAKKKIEKIFMEIWDAKEVPVSIHEISRELFEEYSSEGISTCMRIFAQKYPQKKKDSRMVYGVLEKLFIKNGVEL